MWNMFWVNKRKVKRSEGVGMTAVFMQENFFFKCLNLSVLQIYGLLEGL